MLHVALLIWVGFSFLPDRATSQLSPDAPAPLDFDLDWRWVKFSTADGLPVGTPRDVVVAGVTPWVYTEAGLAYYDGFQWNQPSVPAEFHLDSIGFMSGEPNGQLLVVAAGRVFLGSRDGFEEYVMPEALELHGGRVVRAFMAPGGGLLMTLDVEDADPRLVRVTSDPMTIIVLPDALRSVHSLWRPGRGRIWSNLTDGLYTWSDDSWTRHPVPVSLTVRGDIHDLIEFEDGGGAFLISPGGVNSVTTLNRFSPAGRVKRSTLGGPDRLQSIAMDRNGETGVAVVDSGGVFGLAERVWRILNINGRVGFSINFVRYTEAAGETSIWFGTRDRLHLYRSSMARWESVQRDFSDPRRRVHAVLLHSRTDRLWQTTAGGVNVQTSTTSGWRTEIHGKDVTGATGLAEAADGAVWLSSGAKFEGVLRFTDEWEYFGVEDGFDGGRIHRIVARPDSSVWFATLGGDDWSNAGVYRWHPRTGFEAWSRNHGLPSASTYDILDLGGEVWIANRQGVHRIKEGVTTSYPTVLTGAENGLAQSFALAEVGGRIWFAKHPGGPGGVGYIDPDDDDAITMTSRGVRRDNGPGASQWIRAGTCGSEPTLVSPDFTMAAGLSWGRTRVSMPEACGP